MPLPVSRRMMATPMHPTKAALQSRPKVVLPKAVLPTAVALLQWVRMASLAVAVVVVVVRAAMVAKVATRHREPMAQRRPAQLPVKALRSNQARARTRIKEEDQIGRHAPTERDGVVNRIGANRKGGAINRDEPIGKSDTGTVKSPAATTVSTMR